MDKITFVTAKQVCEMFDISMTTLYRWKDTNPDFPRPMKIGPHSVRYLLSDLEQFQNSREVA